MQKTQSLISDATLLDLYAGMLQCRMLDQEIRRFCRSKKFVLQTGREACIVAAIRDLGAGDWIAPRPLDFMAAWCKDLPLGAVLQQALAKRPVADDPAPLRERVVPPGKSQLQTAVGVALACKAAADGTIVLVFCDASTPQRRSESEWLLNSLHLASTQQLPLLLVVQSAPRPAPGKTRSDLSLLAEKCNVPVFPVDRMDVVAMYRVAHESIHKARRGGGPALMEAVPYRTGPTTAAKGKTVKGRAAEVDALQKMERYLTAKGLFSNPWHREIADEFKNRLDAAFAALPTSSPAGRSKQ